MKMQTVRAFSLYVPQVVSLAVIFNLLVLMPTSKAHADAQVQPIRIVAFGDSLTAGYRLPQNAAFPVQLAAALKARGHNVEIINAGVSGDTTAGGLERLDWALSSDTEAVILELGANDALRALPPAQARSNLEKIISTLKSRNIEVLIAGMAAPRSLGEKYVSEFDRIYPELATKHGLILYPFFLEGVAERPELNLDDGIHPTEEGVGVIVARILPKVEELLTRIAQRRATASKS